MPAGVSWFSSSPAIVAGKRVEKIIVFVRHLISNILSCIRLVVDFDQLDSALLNGLEELIPYFVVLGTTIKKAGTKQAFRKVDYEYPLVIARLSAVHGLKLLLHYCHGVLILILLYFTIRWKEGKRYIRIKNFIHQLFSSISPYRNRMEKERRKIGIVVFKALDFFICWTIEELQRNTNWKSYKDDSDCITSSTWKHIVLSGEMQRSIGLKVINEMLKEKYWTILQFWTWWKSQWK